MLNPFMYRSSINCKKNKKKNKCGTNIKVDEHAKTIAQSRLLHFCSLVSMINFTPWKCINLLIVSD